MKKLKNLLVMAGLATAMTIMVSGCSLLPKSETERTQAIIDAYQTGDIETFQSYIADDEKLNYLLEAIDDTDAEGMKAVYQKVYELTKSAEFSVTKTEESGYDNGEYATVTIKTVDFSDALYTAMVEAGVESKEAFVDAPTWMMNALNNGGVTVEKEVMVRTKSNGSLYDGHEEFFEVLTGGFYDYIVATMTSCEANNGYGDGTYMLSTYDTVRVSLDEYYIPFEGVEYTDDEVNAVINEFASKYEVYDGMAAGGNRVEDGIRLYMIIDYDEVSMSTLKVLDLVSSASGDYIGLKTTINGLESDGYICETTDFGSGVLATEEESTEE